jgi:hypothetical protein
MRARCENLGDCERETLAAAMREDRVAFLAQQAREPLGHERVVVLDTGGEGPRSGLEHAPP